MQSQLLLDEIWFAFLCWWQAFHRTAQLLLLGRLFFRLWLSLLRVPIAFKVNLIHTNFYMVRVVVFTLLEVFDRKFWVLVHANCRYLLNLSITLSTRFLGKNFEFCGTWESHAFDRGCIAFVQSLRIEGKLVYCDSLVRKLTFNSCKQILAWFNLYIAFHLLQFYNLFRIVKWYQQALLRLSSLVTMFDSGCWFVDRLSFSNQFQATNLFALNFCYKHSSIKLAKFSIDLANKLNEPV